MRIKDELRQVRNQIGTMIICGIDRNDKKIDLLIDLYACLQCKSELSRKHTLLGKELDEELNKIEGGIDEGYLLTTRRLDEILVDELPELEEREDKNDRQIRRLRIEFENLYKRPENMEEIKTLLEEYDDMAICEWEAETQVQRANTEPERTDCLNALGALQDTREKKLTEMEKKLCMNI